MANCEPFGDRLLDFVYGLLDEADAQSLRGHLEVCPRCQETLRGAQGQQALLARAAMPIGPEAVGVFNAPAEEPPVAATPVLDGKPIATAPATVAFAPPATSVPAARRRSRRRYWFAGAVAAAVLLAVGMLAYSYEDGHRARVNEIVTQKEVVNEIDAQLAAYEPRFKQQVEAAERKWGANAPLHIYTLAPAQLPPDGGAVVQVAVSSADGKPVAARITASLTDAQGKKVIDRKEVVARGGIASVPLGADIADALRGRKFVNLIAEAQTDTAQARVAETLKIAAPAYVAHLMTNQSVYRPGELLLFRALVLDRATLTPPTEPVALRFSLVDAKGTIVAAATADSGPGGIAAGDMAVTDQWADGQYELRVAALQPGNSEVRPHARKVQLARDLSFSVQADRPWYRPGEIVNLGVLRSQVAQSRATTNNTAAPNAELFLDGQRVPLLSSGPGGYIQPGQNNNSQQPGLTPAPPNASPPTQPSAQPSQAPGGVGGAGAQRFGADFNDLAANSDKSNLNFRFALPKELDTSRVRARIVLTEGKVRETFEQELTVLPSRLAVDLFPEGGDLIAGVPNRVYYRVRSPRGEPVNPEGRVIVLSGSDVLLDSAPGAGSGSFTFTPQAGDSYSVRLTNPGSDAIELADPVARFGGAHKEGLVLHTPQPVAAEGEPLDVVLRNPGPARRVLLVAQCRGRFVGQQWTLANGPETSVALGTLPRARGLVRITAYDASAGSLKPLAERLVYRTPARRLDLTVFHLGGVISPKQGQKSVQMEVRGRDEAGDPANGWLGIAIATDDSSPGREANPVAHFIIAGDVQSGEDLDNATLLASDNPATQQALDLFLGTAGWRRFERAPRGENAAEAPIDAAFIGRENDSLKNLQGQHRAKVDEALTDIRQAMQQQSAQWTSQRQAAQAQLESAQSELRAFEALPREYFRLGLGLAILVLVALAGMALAVGAWRLLRRHQATPLFAGSFACLSLCLIGTLMLASLGPPIEPIAGPSALRGSNDRGAVPGWFNGAPAAAPSAGLPTGLFALAAAPLRREAPQEITITADAKMDDRSAGQLEALAADGQHRTPSKGARGTTLASNKKDGLVELQRRFKDAELSQKAGLDALPGPVPMTALAEKHPAAAGKHKTAPMPKGLAKVAEQQAELETLRRAFIPDFVAGVEFDTLLWHPGLVLSAGSAQIAFDVPAAAGSYRVLLFGNTADGRLGFYEGRLDVQPDTGR
jgi:hypothetical protein